MNFLKIFSDAFQDNWDNPALSDLGSGLSLSYGSLAARMQRVHMLLDSIGARIGSRVAVVGGNSVNWVTAYMGSLTYGATVVTMPACYPVERTLEMLAPTDVEFLFIDRDMVADANPDYSLAPKIKLVISMDTATVLARRPGAVDNPQARLDGLDRAFIAMYPYGFAPADAKAPVIPGDAVSAIFYTSGTTGEPKAVMLMADNLEGNIIYGIKTSLHPRHSNAVSSTTMGTVWGTIFDMLVPLASGASLTVLKDVKNPEALARAFAAVHPGRIMMSALTMEAFYNIILRENSRRGIVRWLSRMPGPGTITRSILRRTVNRMLGGRCQEVLVGNTALGASLAYKLRRAGMKVTVVYGLTECGGLVGYIPNGQYLPGTAGRAIKSLLKCRLRPYALTGSPDDTGVLEVRGMTVMKGYAGNPDATAAVTTPDGWLSTGDIATISPEGDITILGRVDSLITLDRGTVAPEHIETMLYAAPEVTHAIVVERDNKLHAIIQPCTEAIGRLHPGGDVEQTIRGVVADVNRMTSLVEHIDSFEIADTPLLLTAKGTVARHLYPNEGVKF